MFHPLAVMRNPDGTVPGQYTAARASTAYSDGKITVDSVNGVIANVPL
jgi:hypothetical protein